MPTQHDFKQKNLKAYIPRSFTKRFGITRNVPLNYDVNAFINNAVSSPESIKFNYCVFLFNYFRVKTIFQVEDLDTFQSFVKLKRPGALTLARSIRGDQMYYL